MKITLSYPTCFKSECSIYHRNGKGEVEQRQLRKEEEVISSEEGRLVVLAESVTFEGVLEDEQTSI